ncbi:MAG: CvpA family protein [Novosphingobium sp.]
MTGFDIAVLVIVGVAAITGFLRGFVHEVLALSAWVLALLAIYNFHGALTVFLGQYLSAPAAAAVLAFALLLLVPYFTIKLLAGRMGGATRQSLIGPIDRLLGLGFGAIKGLIVVVLAFSVVVLGYDTVWGPAGRPDWITLSRSYPFIDASSNELVAMLAERRAEARAAGTAKR